MKYHKWNNEKNEHLKSERGISFEEVLYYIEKGDLIDITIHPNKDKYPNQKIYIININGYIYLVPFIENENEVFLKTIIPSRKLTKEYFNKDKPNEIK